MKALILSHREAFEADSVIDALKARNCEVFRFNTDDGDTASRISYLINEEQVVLSCDDRGTLLEDIDVGWFQQPYPFEIGSIDHVISLQRANLKAAFDEIEEASDCQWVNKPSAVIKAANKIYQLRVAKAMGMRIPETLISNSPEEIRKFCKKPSVMKNLDTPWYTSADGFKAAYTRIVSEDVLKNEDGISFCPIIYQHLIDKKQECRIVMIAEKAFAVTAESNPELIDIREEEKTGVLFSESQFPEQEKQQLVAYMKKLGIDTCGADYLIDSDGNWYFLEINTCGAWWWVDKHHQGKIKDAIVELIIEKSRRAPSEA